MVDFWDAALTTVLTVGGWIFATLVTVWSIGYAHRKQLESQRAHEDSVATFRPLRKEMESILADERSVAWGGYIWSQSDEFKEIKHRGVLQPARHDGLRHEIELLQELHDEHQKAQNDYYDARYTALRSVFEKVELQLVVGGTKHLTAAVRADNHELHQALAGDREKWVDAFKRALGETKSQVDLRTMKPTPGELFDELEELTAESYSAYRTSVTALLGQAKKIRGILDLKIRDAG